MDKLPDGKWCKCGMPHETGGPCWECRAECPVCLDHGKILTQDGADECPVCAGRTAFIK
jgi:hypothetical protein